MAGFFPSPDGAAIIAAGSDAAAFVAVGGVRADVGGENTVPASQLLLLVGGVRADVGGKNTVAALQLLLLLGVFVQM